MIPIPTPTQALAIGVALLIAGLAASTLWYRGAAIEARAERDHLRDQVAVVAEGLRACNAAVDQAKRVGDAATAATAELQKAARRLAQPAQKTVERIETIIEKGTPPGAGCEQAWTVIENDAKASRGGK